MGGQLIEEVLPAEGKLGPLLIFASFGGRSRRFPTRPRRVSDLARAADRPNMGKQPKNGRTSKTSFLGSKPHWVLCLIGGEMFFLTFFFFCKHLLIKYESSFQKRTCLMRFHHSQPFELEISYISARLPIFNVDCNLSWLEANFFF